MIFADTVEMLSLFHYKFELSHLPKMGGGKAQLFIPHALISNCYSSEFGSEFCYKDFSILPCYKQV